MNAIDFLEHGGFEFTKARNENGDLVATLKKDGEIIEYETVKREIEQLSGVDYGLHLAKLWWKKHGVSTFEHVSSDHIR